MKINLTDQELNEWVAVNVMKWNKKKVPYIVINGTRYDDGPFWMTDIAGATPDKPASGDSAFIQPPDYCNNLNHVYLMEEKVREMDKWEDFASELGKLMGLSIYWIAEARHFKSDLAHASARQRVEAAYLTFQEKA